MTRAAVAQPPLIVHIVFALKTGGLENGLVNLINRTSPERYRHAIICLTESDEFAQRLKPKVPIYALGQQPGQDWGCYWRLWRRLRQLRPALVHTRNLATLEMQLLTACLPGVKRVHGEHGRDIYDLHGRNYKYRLLRRFMVHWVHRYICVSQDLERWLIDQVGVPAVKVEQIYNGVDQQSFQPLSPQAPASRDIPEDWISEKKWLVGSVGRLAEVKNHQLLLAALAEVLRQAPTLRERIALLLVGDGPLKLMLQERVRELGLERQVHFFGDSDNVGPLLRRMNVFVLPSLGEGLSNTLLEAMASGIAVIATRVGGNPELVRHGDNGLLVDEQSPQELADALRQLQADSELTRHMGQQGLQRVCADFHWDVCLARYLSVYDRLLGLDDAPRAELVSGVNRAVNIGK